MIVSAENSVGHCGTIADNYVRNGATIRTGCAPGIQNDLSLVW